MSDVKVLKDEDLGKVSGGSGKRICPAYPHCVDFLGQCEYDGYSPDRKAFIQANYDCPAQF